MSKKTTIIFIIVFILIGTIILGLYLWLNKEGSTTTKEEETSWYQNFNPFGSGEEQKNNNNQSVDGSNNINNTNTNTTTTKSSKFYQITDFAIAGGTFLIDIRPNINSLNTPKVEPVKVTISANTKEGRKEIQTILNEKLSLNPPLIVDGNFGKLATAAIKNFQKLNNLPITGVIDTATAPLFTKEVSMDSSNIVDQVPSVRYVERMNGHIYKMFLDTKVKEKISNSTIPGIYEAFFDKSGNTVIYRYLSEDGIINTFMATLGAPKGEFLAQGISDLSVSRDKSKFFYLVENANGVTGTIGAFGDTKKDVVFNSPFTEWLSTWSDNGIFLTTKASSGVNGSVFLLNNTNKTILKTFGGVSGLTSLISPNGLFVLYGSSEGDGYSLGVFDIEKHTTKDFGFGLPEKCVWSNDNINVYCGIPNSTTEYQYPDLWYQGVVSFDDSFVKINTITGEKIVIANSTEETAIDGTSLFLDNTESTLFFTNKKDSTLWSLNLK